MLVLNNFGERIDGSSYLFPLLNDKFKVIAIKTRDSHPEPSTWDGLTFNLIASDINELLNQLQIDSVYILRQGGGANTALFLAMEHPEKVKKILAFNANILSDTTAFEPKIYNWYDKTSKSTNMLLEKKSLLFILKQPNISFSELKKIKAEVLLMSADRGEIRLNHTFEIFKSIPKSQLCILPGSKFLNLSTNKELIQLLILNFFDKPFIMPNAIDRYAL